MFEPRKWQLNALEVVDQLLITNHQDCLIAACVAAGKTPFAIEAYAHIKNAGRARQVIVVTFTSHLVRQWGAKATKAGLNLQELKSNRMLEGGLPSDVEGYICTYAMMGSWPELHEAFAHNRPTLVIFDEIHHLADDPKSRWGEKAKKAFSGVAFRLALSGTPFRSNSTKIPFITYEPVDGSNTKSKAIAHYPYSLGEGVADGICRRVRFDHVDGPIRWKRSDKDHPLEIRFSDEIEEYLLGDRLRFATTAEYKGAKCDNQLMIDMLKRASNKLNDVRASGHADAGGLIIASDIAEARNLKRLLRDITGQIAIVVVNDEPESLEKITAFTNGTSPWIIAVKMITEGVDIDRLRVCAYAARVTEELFFIQVVGRIVRKPKSHPYGESYFYYPADERLIEHATRIEKEIDLRIQEKQKEKNGNGGGEKHSVDREFIDATSETWATTIAGDTFDEKEVSAADTIRSRYANLKNVDLSDLMKFVRDVKNYEQAPEQSGHTTQQSYSSIHSDLRSEIQTKVGRLNRLTGTPHNEIHVKLNQVVGIRNKDVATIQQLETMLAHVKEWIASIENGPVAAGHDYYEDFDEASDVD